MHHSGRRPVEKYGIQWNNSTASRVPNANGQPNANQDARYNYSQVVQSNTGVNTQPPITETEDNYEPQDRALEQNAQTMQ